MVDFHRSRKEELLHRKIRTATWANKAEELRVLLSKNEAKKLIRKSGGKVLSRCLIDAIGLRHIESLQDLLKAGAYLCIVGRCDPVRRTIEYGGDLGVLRLLLDYRASPDQDSGLDPCKPLYLAAKFADLGCFRLLLLYGADPDYNCSGRNSVDCTADDRSVLGMCLENDYEAPFVNLLIQFGANMYLPDIQRILLHVENDATKLLERERAHPRSLMSQSRIAIRRLLKQAEKLCLIDMLEIPNELRKYLKYHNELDTPEKLPRHDKEYLLVFINPLNKRHSLILKATLQSQGNQDGHSLSLAT